MLKFVFRGGSAPARVVRRGWEGKSIPKQPEPVQPKVAVVGNLIDLSSSGTVPVPTPVTPVGSFSLQTSPLHNDLPANSPAFIPTSSSPQMVHIPHQPSLPQLQPQLIPIQQQSTHTVVYQQPPMQYQPQQLPQPQTVPTAPSSAGPTRRASVVVNQRSDGVLKEGYVTKKSGRVFICTSRLVPAVFLRLA